MTIYNAYLEAAKNVLYSAWMAEKERYGVSDLIADDMTVSFIDREMHPSEDVLLEMKQVLLQSAPDVSEEELIEGETYAEKALERSDEIVAKKKADFRLILFVGIFIGFAGIISIYLTMMNVYETTHDFKDYVFAIIAAIGLTIADIFTMAKEFCDMRKVCKNADAKAREELDKHNEEVNAKLTEKKHAEDVSTLIDGIILNRDKALE